RGIVTGCAFSGGSAGRPLTAAFADFAAGDAAGCDEEGEAAGDASGDGEGVGDEAFDKSGVGEGATAATCARADAAQARHRVEINAALRSVLIVSVRRLVCGGRHSRVRVSCERRKLFSLSRECLRRGREVRDLPSGLRRESGGRRNAVADASTPELQNFAAPPVAAD